MNWDDLRIVLATARSRTLIGAASSLGVAHSTVGRRLRSVEQSLGVQLFDRTPGGLVPTDAGHDLIEAAEQVERTVLGVQGRVEGRDQELQGPLRVSTFDAVFSACRGAFASFVARYPSIELTVGMSAEPVSLHRREADVVLRMSSTPPEELVGRRVGRMPMAVFAHPALAERVDHSADYSAYPWVGLDRARKERWLDAWMAAHAPGAQVAVWADSHATLLAELVQAGVGVFFLPVWQGKTLGLHRVGPVLQDLPTDVWLLTHRDLRHNRRVRAFMDHMGQHLPTEPAFRE